MNLVKEVAACGGLGTEVGEEFGMGYCAGSEFVEWEKRRRG